MHCRCFLCGVPPPSSLHQDCLELIENRTQGLLALLDEQCVVPKATDMSYAGRYRYHLPPAGDGAPPFLAANSIASCKPASCVSLLLMAWHGMCVAGRLYEKCLGQHGRFSVSAKDRVDYRFTIRHYAGAVTYDTTGFLEKNRDQLYQVGSTDRARRAHR